MDDNIKLFSLGAFIGAVVLAACITIMPTSLIRQAHKVINECEAELPHNQQCVLTAEPKVSNE